MLYEIRWPGSRARWSRLADALKDWFEGANEAAEIFRVHDDGREERLPTYEEALALLGADPLAALEAAERRLLEAGGWREIEPGGRWYHPVIGHRWKGAALADEKSRRRERLAAKGGA